MTFHGKPRASRDVMNHVHESPFVMLVPLFLLALGALFAGLLFKESSSGTTRRWSTWGTALSGSGRNCLSIPDTPSYRVPALVWSPFVADGDRVCGVVAVSIFDHRNCPGSWRAQHEPLYKFLLNKWYFDELYDLIFVRPAMWLGRFLWKKGDGWMIDGLGPDGVSARVWACNRSVNCRPVLFITTPLPCCSEPLS